MTVVSEKDCRIDVYRQGFGRPTVVATHIATGRKVTVDGYPLEIHARHAALHQLTEELASPEQKALVDAMSYSNVDMEFEGSEHAVDSSASHRVASGILEGLAESGWKLVPPAAGLGG